MATDLPPDEYLTLQKGVLLSPAVRGDQDLTIRTDKGEGTIAISIESTRPQQAEVSLALVTDSYLKTSGGQQTDVVKKIADLTAKRERLATARAAKDKALSDFKKQANLSGTQADSVITARRDQLAAALAAAQKDAATAKANAEIAANLPTDPQQLAILFAAARKAGAFDPLDNDRDRSQDQLKEAEALLAKQQQSLGAQHPAILQQQAKIALLKEHLAGIDKRYAAAYREHCIKQLQASASKVTELQTLLDQQTQKTQSAAGAVGALAQLEADLKKTDDAVTEIDKQIRSATLSVDSGVHMKLIQPATAPDRPSHPNRTFVLLTAAIVGVIVGLLMLFLPGGRSQELT